MWWVWWSHGNFAKTSLQCLKCCWFWIASEMNRSKQDRSWKSYRKLNGQQNVHKMEYDERRGQSHKSGKDSNEESPSIAIATAWQGEKLLAQEDTQKALLASSKLEHIFSGLKLILKMIFHLHSDLSDCMVTSLVWAYMALIMHISSELFQRCKMFF